MWVEFVVGSLSGSERIFSGYSGVSLYLKTNTSKLQFNLEYTQIHFNEFLRTPKCSVDKQNVIYD